MGSFTMRISPKSFRFIRSDATNITFRMVPECGLGEMKLPVNAPRFKINGIGKAHLRTWIDEDGYLTCHWIPKPKKKRGRR